MARKSREEAERTRQAIAQSAFDLGSAQGLETLSIANIADHLGMSKSGVAGHFDSKVELQLAAVNRAAEQFTDEIWEPNQRAKAGKQRLRRLMYGWMDYVADRKDLGGCMLTAAAFEFDDRPGPVKDRVAEIWRTWMAVLAADAKAAGLNGASTVFKLHAIVTEAMWMNQLYGDGRGWQIAKEAVEEVIEA